METTSATVEMTYNAMYQQVQKAVDGGPTTRFIYDHKRLLAETDENDTTTRSFTSGTAGANSEYGDLVSEYDAQSLEEVFDRGYKALALYTYSNRKPLPQHSLGECK